MANEYNPMFFEPTVVGKESNLGETIGAMVGQRVNPLYETINQTVQFGIQREAGYTPFDDEQTKGYEQYASTWGRATNPTHMASILKTIDDSNSRRQVIADASTGNQVVSGFFDPINLVAIPLGGPVVGIGRSALRGAVSVGAVELGAELLVAQPFDATQTAEESAMNVLTSSLFGGVLGGAASAPLAMKAGVYNNTRIAIQEEMAMHRRIDNLTGLTREDIANAPPRDQRPFGSLSKEDLALTIRGFEGIAQRSEAEAQSYQGRVEYDDFASRAQEQRDQATAYKNELGLRELEDMQIDLKDPYRIMPSAFTESVFYKAVTTPMKRALQSDIPSSVKETFVRSFNDSGMALAFNSIGIATPNSVHQLAAVSNGRWVAAHDQLIRLWSKETNASLAGRGDVNYTDVARRLSRSDDTFRKWLSSVNDKRIRNAEDLTEGDMAALDVINTYFKDAERKLESVGLIGTQKGITQKISQLENEIAGLNARLERVIGRKDARSRRQESLLNARKDMLVKNAEVERATLAAFNENPSTALDDDVFFPRFWDSSAIKSNRDAFSKVLFDWYQKNPYTYELNVKTGEWEKVNFSTDPASIQARVDSSIQRILGEEDPTNVDKISFGYGRSKHFRHRQIDIPNKLVADFIVKDPLSVMKTYAARIEPRYEYAKMFGKDVDGVLLDMELDMIAKGASDAEINAVRKDYMHMYDRVAGAVIRNPSALSQKIAFFLREAASFAYMGSAGLSALPDFGRIVMEYDAENIARGVQALMDKESVNMTVDEIRIAGEAIDSLKGMAHMRMMEDMSNNIDANDVLSSARNAFYMLNGLAPMTTIAKQLAGIIDAHTIIDYSIKLTNGKLDAQSTTWLARYGIDADKAALIARAPWQKSDNGLYMANTEQWADSIYIPELEGKRVKVIEINDDGTPVGKMRNGRYIPAFYREGDNTIRFDRDYIEGPMFAEKAWLNPKMEGVNALPDIFNTPKQWSNFVMLHEINHTRFSRESLGFNKKQTAEYENAINDMALKDYREAQTINEETVSSFRVALNSGVLNTIMAGTPADKPIITDGVAYIPMSVAAKFGMKEDPRVKGYARIENGLMGLPFQFYSYTLANVNKTIGALATGQVKNRALGVTTMLGLAYLSLKLKTPDYIWEDMSWQDRFARSFDQSGVAALYSDIFYTSMHTALALGGPNITGGLLSPKFPQEPSMLDAVTGFAGAGPSWLQTMGEGAYQFANGEAGAGAKTIARNMPFARMWFWKDEMNQITHAWAN
jgi:hypothetical protein